MKVGDDTLYKFPMIAWIDKYLSVYSSVSKMSTIVSKTLKRANTRGSYGDNSLSLTFCLIESLRCFRRNICLLWVHIMISDIFYLDICKSSKSYMEANPFYLDSFFLKCFQKFWSEVKPSGWSCDTSRFFFVMIDCLVSWFVTLICFFDVRRKRGFSNHLYDI